MFGSRANMEKGVPMIWASQLYSGVLGAAADKEHLVFLGGFGSSEAVLDMSFN